MSNTPERIQAHNRLHEAIRQVGDITNDDRLLLIDWVVVSAWAVPDNEEETSYFLAFPNGTIPSYRARGLLDMGRELMIENDRKDE
jgi:hypothetical protein